MLYPGVILKISDAKLLHCILLKNVVILTGSVVFKDLVISRTFKQCWPIIDHQESQNVLDAGITE